MSDKDYLEAGKIANTHGINGDVVVESYCDSPEVLAALPVLYLKNGAEYRALTIKKASLFKGRVLFHFASYESIEDAIPLKNRLVYAKRTDFALEEGCFFIADLIGLPILDNESGECYGTLSDVLNYGASDIYEITRQDGKKSYVPVVDEFVKRVDPAHGIFLSVIEGLL